MNASKGASSANMSRYSVDDPDKNKFTNKLKQRSDLSLTTENSQIIFKRNEMMLGSSKYTLDESKLTGAGCSISNFTGSNETQSIKTKPKTSKEILQEIARLTNGTSSRIRNTTTDTADTSFKSKSINSHNS